MAKQHWIMDYETNMDCFLGVFESYKSKETHIFVIGLLQNDIKSFIHFLQQNIKNNEWHISFNGINFDSQITQFVIENARYLLSLTGVSIAKEIYDVAQKSIALGNERKFQIYPPHKLSIKQIDVFKLNHWDNPAKRSSLKWIQCSMDWHNVQDMPLDHRASIDTQEKLDVLISYCKNDVESTKKIFELSIKQINLRINLSKQYKVNLYSASEPRIAKELFLYFLSKKTGVSKYELKKLRTFRTHIYVKDIILPYIKFDDNPEFKELLRHFNNLVLNPNDTKGGFKYSIKYRGVKTDFGLGGVHGARKGLYESDEFMTIMTSDVVSYYPNLAIRNKWSPGHISTNIFCEQYEWFFNERKLIPKSNPQNYVYKIILNSTYGLSNDKNCFLYDPEFTMRITVNGQLSLMMLYVDILNNIPGSVPIMQNTDGVEIMIPRKYKDKYLEICKNWEDLTKLKLEHDEYQKLIIPDVNNYIGVFKTKEVTKDEFYKAQKDNPDNVFTKKNSKYYVAKTKCKGRFEFKNRPLHKNKSFTVIPKAIYNYFVHGIEPENYLKTNTNIFDWCGQTKVKGQWKFEEQFVKEGVIQNIPLQKTLRYMVTTRGSKILKKNIDDGRIINVEAGKWLQTTFNKFEKKEFKDYGLDQRFYLTKIKNEIMNIHPNAFSTQLSIDF